jgi:hypothetical protein
MIVTCDTCGLAYDDTFHLTYCPHDYFPMRTVGVRSDGTMKVCTTLEDLDRFLHGEDVA